MRAGPPRRGMYSGGASSRTSGSRRWCYRLGYSAGEHDEVESDNALGGAIGAGLIGVSGACRGRGRLATGHPNVLDVSGRSVAAVQD